MAASDRNTVVMVARAYADMVTVRDLYKAYPTPRKQAEAAQIAGTLEALGAAVAALQVALGWTIGFTINTAPAEPPESPALTEEP